MVLVTHQLQGSSATFPSRPLLCCRGVKLKQHKSAVCFSARTDRSFFLKRNVLLGVGARIHGTRVRPFRITAFKGNASKDESGRRANGSASKNSIKLPYLPKENEDCVHESPKVHSVPVSYTSDSGDKERITASPAIRRLFKKWLNILCTESPRQDGDQIMGDELPPSQELLQTENATESYKNVRISKSILSRILELDAAIKIPITIFIPLYLAVNVIYGAEVSKDLTPLWMLGPLIVASYVKMLQGLCMLYLFSFRQAVKLMKSLPGHYRVAHSFVAQGKLKEYVQARLVQPIVSLKDLDYKELSRKEMKRFQDWLEERYLDFVEGIWPSYCRTIRFLKRAHLI